MHRTMKKVWAIVLTLCLLVGVLPIGAQAALLQGEDYITQQLSLGEDLVLHLRASLPEQYKDLAKDATGTLTYAGKSKTYTMDDLTPDENGMYDMSVEMAVAEMTEDIHAVINAKVMGIDSEIINEHYSIRDYLVAIIEGDYSQTTKDLCLELLNMGAWAQLYFNHNISDLANAGYSTSAANSVPEEIPAVDVAGKVDGIQFYGTSVRFLSQTAVRFYFVADSAVDGYTFTIDGTTYEPVAKDGMYYIETPGINPQNMSDVIDVEVNDGTNTLSVGYAPIWYFIRTYNKTEDEYNKGLMEAAYSYYKQAESYKTQICMDLDISTLSGSFESIGLGFYPLSFEGDINNYTDRIEVPTGTTYTVKLDQGEYLVDGEFKGIGITVLGGPTYDATLEDGTPDKHNITISNLRLEGPEDRPIDLTFATIASGTNGTGYTNANAGTATVADGIISISNGIFTDGYKITFNEVDTFLKLDMEIDTLSGNYETIGIGFYPYDFEGDINNQIDRIDVPTGTPYTVKLDLSKYLVDGELPGIGITVLGGPAWDAKLEDGTPDRHNITVSNIRLEGELNQSIDLSKASLKSGQDGTGFTNANAGGTATVADGIISISNGFFTDGYKILFVDETIPDETEPEVTEPEVTEPEVTEPDTYLKLDMEIGTLSGNYEAINIGFYPYNFEGDINNHTDIIEVPTGSTYTVNLDASKYLIDGEIPGIGITVLGGPAWDAKLEDGYTPDRHTITVSNIRLEGEMNQSFDLSRASLKSGQDGTGYTNAQAGGTATVADGVISIANGFFTDGYKITFNEVDTFLKLDMEIDTLSGNYETIGIGFYPYDFEGDINNQIDRIDVPTGTPYTVKLDLSKYLVDGELPGIGITVLGGPAWDAKLEDGYTPDRHNITVSNIRLEGELNQSIDLSKASLKSGTNGTGYTNAQAGGTATVTEGIISISNGFFTDGYKILFVDETIPDETEPEPTDPPATDPPATDPPVEEYDTTLCLDVKLDTVTGVWENDVEIRFYAYNFEGNAHESYTDSVMFKVGEQQTVKLDAAKYLVDGKLNGIGIGVFGGPVWNTQISDGVYDRHTVTISNVCLEGEQSVAYDLNKSVVTSGTDGTGFTGDVFGPGEVTIGESIVLSDGFQYFAHKISLVEDTRTFVTMDMQIDTLGGDWANDIEMRFYNYGFEGNPHNTYTDVVIFKAGKKQTVKLNAEKYLVDGKLTGIGIGIFGGPEWNTQISDGVYDRHTVTISNVKLEGGQSVAYDLSQSTIASGKTNTGYTDGNGSGVGSFSNGVYQITNGFCYDCHKISLVEDTSTYLCMDLEFTTLSNSNAPVNVRLFNYNYEGSVGDGYTDLVVVTAGTTTKIKVKVDNYLVDGELPGFGIAVFGGPEWNTQMEDGTYDRHAFVLSNVRLEGVQEQSFDLNDATVANGTSGTGFTWANSGGVASIVDGELVVTGGFMYDAYEITF